MLNGLTAVAVLVVVFHALLSYAIFGLGVAAAVTPQTLAWASAAALLLTLVAAKRLWPSVLTGKVLSNTDALILACGSALIVAPFLHVLVLPPFHEDDLIYHLNVPKRILQTGALLADPFSLTTNFPMLFEMPFTALLASEWPISPLLLNVLYLYGYALAFAAFLRSELRVTLPWTLAATLAFVWIPLHYAIVQSCYVELFLGLVTLLGLQFYLRSLSADGLPRDWLMSMLFLGFGAATKYLGLWPLAAVVLAELVRPAERRRLALGILVAALVALPWYVKNWLLLGNPLYPFAPQLFPTPELSVDRYIKMKTLLDFYNEGTALKDYFMLPLRVLWAGDWTPQPGSFGFGGKLSLLCVLAAFSGGYQGQGARTIRWMLLVYLVVWTASAQNVRYLMPFLVLPIAFGLKVLLERGRSARWFAAVLLLLAVVQNAWNIVKDMRDLQIDQVVLGTLSSDAFLSARIPQVKAASELANRHLDPLKDRAMFIGGFGRALLIDAPVLANTFSDVELFNVAFARGSVDPTIADQFFARQGITHLLLIDATARKLLQTLPDLDANAVDRYLAAHTTVVESQAGASLLKLR